MARHENRIVFQAIVLNVGVVALLFVAGGKDNAETHHARGFRRRDPNDTITYINRAWAHCRKRAFEYAWADVHRAERLGMPTLQRFLKELRAASGREN